MVKIIVQRMCIDKYSVSYIIYKMVVLKKMKGMISGETFGQDTNN